MYRSQRDSVAYNLKLTSDFAPTSLESLSEEESMRELLNGTGEVTPFVRGGKEFLGAAAEVCCQRFKARSAHVIISQERVHHFSCSGTRSEPVGEDDDYELASCVAELVRCKREVVRLQVSGARDEAVALGAPLVSPDGSVLGAIVIVDADVSIAAPPLRLETFACQISAMLPQAARNPREGVPVPYQRYRFRMVGEYWSIGPSKQPFHMKDARGLHYIAELLRHPEREFHACDLILVDRKGQERGTVSQLRVLGGDCSVGTSTGLGGGAYPLLDARAKGAYKVRLQDLRSEMDEAERYNDSGRLAELRREYDFLVQQVASAVGLGGCDRPGATPAERARLAVTKRIKDALKKITLVSPDLGDSLSRSIRTGYYCSYVADRTNPIAWEP